MTSRFTYVRRCFGALTNACPRIPTVRTRNATKMGRHVLPTRRERNEERPQTTVGVVAAAPFSVSVCAHPCVAPRSPDIKKIVIFDCTTVAAAVSYDRLASIPDYLTPWTATNRIAANRYSSVIFVPSQFILSVATQKPSHEASKEYLALTVGNRSRCPSSDPGRRHG
jgi:hypothetical protein